MDFYDGDLSSLSSDDEQSTSSLGVAAAVSSRLVGIGSGPNRVHVRFKNRRTVVFPQPISVAVARPHDDDEYDGDLSPPSYEEGADDEDEEGPYGVFAALERAPATTVAFGGSHTSVDSSLSPVAKPNEKRRRRPGTDAEKKEGKKQDEGAEIAIVRHLGELRIIGDVQGAQDVPIRKAVHLPSQMLMALKPLARDVSHWSASKMALQLRGLVNANVMRCYGQFLLDGRQHLLLEWMDGGSLLDFLRCIQVVPEKYLACVARHALEGLAALHDEAHLAHGNIKPSNILLAQSGSVKLSDFGGDVHSAAAAGEDDETRRGAAAFGREGLYQSPERMQGGSCSFGADVWSLGLTLLECAVGYFPYYQSRRERREPPRTALLMERVMREEPPRASPRKLSPEFADFVAQTMRKDPAQRASAAQLLDHAFLTHQSPDVSLGAWVRAALKYVRHRAPPKRAAAATTAAPTTDAANGSSASSGTATATRTPSDSRTSGSRSATFTGSSSTGSSSTGSNSTGSDSGSS